MPDSRGRFLRGGLRAPPVLGGPLPVHRSGIAADVLAGITLAAVSIPWLGVLGFGIEGPGGTSNSS